MNARILLLILASVSISAFAQLALKRGMSSPTVQQALAEPGLAEKLFSVATSPMILLGLSLYGLGTVVWLLVLARIDVSQAYPFVGLGFVITLALGAFLLGEAVTPLKLAGTALIALGIVALSHG